MSAALTPAVPPQYLFVEVTSACNLRCQQCHLWRTTEPAGTLTTDEKLDAVRDFVSFAQRPTIVMTGGEPTSKMDEFFAIARLCRELGMSCAANTNGTLLTPGDANRLVEEGPKYLVASIDSARPELHDRIRGVPGTFERITSLVRALDRARRHRAERVTILVSAIVCDLNLDELASFTDFALELGADRVLFQMLGRTFARRTARDVFFERHFPRDLARFDGVIDALVAARRAGKPIETTETDLAWMKLYVRNPDFIGEQVCGSHERNLMLDMHGHVQLCFSMRSLLGGRALGNVREQGLRELWEGEMARDARRVMSECRRNCGMLNCHRRAS